MIVLQNAENIKKIKGPDSSLIKTHVYRSQGLDNKQ